MTHRFAIPEERLLAIVQSHSSGQDGAHDIGHLKRVWRNCEHIGERMPSPPDWQVLSAAAYLHDLVNLPKNDPDRGQASRRSAQAAIAELRRAAFQADKLAAVAHAIEAHSYSADIAPASTEAEILQDADRLDALGAIGVMRTFCVAGQLGSALFHPDDPAANARPLDDTRYALDHFKVKLYGLAALMKTAPGRELAEQRVDFMRYFEAQFLRDL